MKKVLLSLTAFTMVLTCTLEKTMPVHKTTDDCNLSIAKTDLKYRNIKTEYNMERDSSAEKEANPQFLP